MFVEEYITKLKPYEGGKPIEELRRELGIKGEIIKLASNENPLGPSKKAIKAIKKIAESVNLYPDGDCYYLKEKLSNKLGVSRDNLVFGNGSDELLELIFRTFATKNGDEILYCYPSFVEYKIIGSSFNKKLVEVPLKGFSYDIDELIKAINSNTRIIFLNTPNNPTGTIIKRSDIERVIEATDSNKTLVVIDEAYYEYAIAEDDYEELLDLYKKGNVVILRTFSKAYGLAGLRIGYGIAGEEIIDYLNRVRPPFNVNLVAQHAALAALDDEEHIRRSVEVNRAGKEYLYREFDNMGITYIKTYANFILFDAKKDANYVYGELLKRGVIVRSMAGYGYKSMLRVTIGTPRENEIFIKNLREVLDV
ncbi:histidinol-phosphate transaminase [Hippea maritima]|uniref:Histidinol-phosphate aminotransferase n=1 Tax=Hippea maritima (strain ATCC 700847 / DSM 10411 / MH2) TaxID=760142 RepID=F2LW77_HIPMA|nr:histidinol-phosphate transaminase [Hippea maritima]AEA34011.1 Histidinol-phosphate aminotransferase [Hippea maritima DSM 10411]